MNYELFLNAIDPADREQVNRAVKDALKSKQRYEVEMRVPLEDGKTRWILAQGRGRYDIHGNPVRMSGIAMEITERKVAQQRLQEALQSRDDMMAMLSHDLKNPLTSIDLSAALLMRSSTGNSSEVVRSSAERVRGSARRMLELIDDMLDISRIEAGQLTIKAGISKAKDAVESALSELRPIAKEKGIAIAESLACAGDKIACEPNRVAQVISNLVGNAIKFSPSPGGRIEVVCERRYNEVVFSISDNGPGIRPEELPHVFDRFWRGKESKKAGTGLGLAIAHGIVSAHYGRIWVENNPKPGATFKFSIPLADSELGRQLLGSPEQDKKAG